VNQAFTASLGLPAVFMIADEVFQQYEVDRAHVLFFTAPFNDFAGVLHLPLIMNRLTGPVKRLPR
jgi:hypothetical protein